MSEAEFLNIRKDGRAGRITLTRPQALNALSQSMCAEIAATIDAWAVDETVEIVILDATGERAFCAGGDIAEIYEAGRAGDMEIGARYWADEYRMNAKLFHFPRPVISFMQGYTMGGGVGLGCHASHRMVGDSSILAMPEVGIGLVPDVGGTLILSRAQGRLGEYLGVTGARMTGADAIYAGFADYYIPEADWPALISELCESADYDLVDQAAAGHTAPAAPLAALQAEIDHHFGGETLRDILNALEFSDSNFATSTLAEMGKKSPLSMACTVELVHRARLRDTIENALEQEYRFTSRAVEKADFLEGVRAQIIDKDRNPNWMHSSPRDVPPAMVASLLLPLGPRALKLD